MPASGWYEWTAVPGSKAQGGLLALSEFIEANVPEAERPRAGEVLVRILNGTLFELAQLSRERAGLQPLPRDERTQGFMTQAVLALSDAFAYPAPMAFELKDFTQLQASVFQVTRSPGRYIVYLGCALLILGVFAMLYVRERRLFAVRDAFGIKPLHYTEHGRIGVAAEHRARVGADDLCTQRAPPALHPIGQWLQVLHRGRSGASLHGCRGRVLGRCGRGHGQSQRKRQNAGEDESSDLASNHGCRLHETPAWHPRRSGRRVRAPASLPGR